MSIIIAILVLGFIIFIHEFGHFLVAKFFKVPVREFSIGMGPRLISKVWHNTRYSLKALPFGGSCAMIGEDPSGSGDFTMYDGEETDDGMVDFEGVKFTKEELENNNFAVIAPYKKFLIALAGPFANFLLAFVLAFIIVARIGFDLPIISGVRDGSAVAEASPYVMEAGDEIVEMQVPGEKEKVESYRDISLFMQLNEADIKEYNYPVIISFKRTGQIYKTVAYPKYDEEYKRVMLGVSFENVYKKPTSFIQTCDYAVREFTFYIRTTVMSLRMLIRGRLSTNDISGPVGTVSVMGDVIEEAKTVNFESLLYTLFMLIVLISSNLGVMNLLPIPALDGGRIVFAAIEMIIGRPIDKNFEATANAITMILLLLFMGWVFGLDIYKLMTK